MYFIVTGYDGTDGEALSRRMAARAGHLELAESMYEKGTFLFAAGILNDAGTMIGSMIVCDFPSRKELDDWLAREPYILGKVWEQIEVSPAQPAPFCLARS
ncbi:MAG TPA: YciI family protein [Thermoanaerobaculia bacterium]|nr:YciI family protein [Thermoanaerobaculia bacterium]HUM29609.1 YciI family protein [Thermoanaerobaculia bacterium]HXK67260.1 YciI family protein [Thermoanaerobaculia bacterium]